MFYLNFYQKMTKRSVFLRNVIAGAICLTGIFSSSLLAQTVDYTDASGVKCTYDLSRGQVVEGEGPVADIVRIKELPATVTKWVLPETITTGGITYKVYGIDAGAFYDFLYPERVVVSTTLIEIVFPKYMYQVLPSADWYFYTPNIRKITFGERMHALGQGSFVNLPLDSVIFSGSDVFSYSYADGGNVLTATNAFGGCPSYTKVIVPCGRLADFVMSFILKPEKWRDEEDWMIINNSESWTVANFYEAECLNTLTVLSSDVNLGNAISLSGYINLTTTTPDNTTAIFSGTATLYALAKAGKLFVGWADGNVDNPRTVTVSSDTTFTANFATCENTGIEETRSSSAGIQVYPNPANNTLNVQLEKFVNNGTLTMFDMSGKIVLSQAINSNSAKINLSSLTAGNYILRLVENGQASAGVKVVKE